MTPREHDVRCGENSRTVQEAKRGMPQRGEFCGPAKFQTPFASTGLQGNNSTMTTVQDPLEGSEEFMMNSFKVLPCPKGYRHNWKRCPFAHEGESERRRDPRRYKYSAIVCPATKKGVDCPSGDDCPWAHNVFEYWLHPQRFRTELCSKKDLCKRRFCFFAHSKSELRDSKVESEQGFTNSVNAVTQAQAGITSVLPCDHPTRNTPCYALPSNADILGMHGGQEGTGIQVDFNGNCLWNNSVQGSFLKHEIHDSLASLPENMGWGSVTPAPPSAEDFQGSYLAQNRTNMPHLYLGPRGSTDRPPVSQDTRENLIPALGPSRVSPRQDFQNLLVPPLQPNRMSPRQHMDENFQAQVAAMRFSPRQNVPVPLPSAMDRFSPRQAPVDQINSTFAAWSDALSSMDSVQDFLLASGMSHTAWNCNPLDSVDERITGRTSFGSGVAPQTIRLLESLDINNTQGSMEQQGGNSLVGPSSDELFCDHLNFFTDP